MIGVELRGRWALSSKDGIGPDFAGDAQKYQPAAVNLMSAFDPKRTLDAMLMLSLLSVECRYGRFKEGATTLR